jgi:hypothetical protein
VRIVLLGLHLHRRDPPPRLLLLRGAYSTSCSTKERPSRRSAPCLMARFVLAPPPLSRRRSAPLRRRRRPRTLGRSDGEMTATARGATNKDLTAVAMASSSSSSLLLGLQPRRSRRRSQKWIYSSQRGRSCWGFLERRGNESALHCTALHCTALHCTALHCTALHCTALHCTALHCTVLQALREG